MYLKTNENRLFSSNLLVENNISKKEDAVLSKEEMEFIGNEIFPFLGEKLEVIFRWFLFDCQNRGLPIAKIFLSSTCLGKIFERHSFNYFKRFFSDFSHVPEEGENFTLEFLIVIESAKKKPYFESFKKVASHLPVKESCDFLLLENPKIRFVFLSSKYDARCALENFVLPLEFYLFPWQVQEMLTVTSLDGKPSGHPRQISFSLNHIQQGTLWATLERMVQGDLISLALLREKKLFREGFIYALNRIESYAEDNPIAAFILTLQVFYIASFHRENVQIEICAFCKKVFSVFFLPPVLQEMLCLIEIEECLIFSLLELFFLLLIVKKKQGHGSLYDYEDTTYISYHYDDLVLKLCFSQEEFIEKLLTIEEKTDLTPFIYLCKTAFSLNEFDSLEETKELPYEKIEKIFYSAKNPVLFLAGIHLYKVKTHNVFFLFCLPHILPLFNSHDRKKILNFLNNKILHRSQPLSWVTKWAQSDDYDFFLVEILSQLIKLKKIYTAKGIVGLFNNVKYVSTILDVLNILFFHKEDFNLHLLQLLTKLVSVLNTQIPYLKQSIAGSNDSEKNFYWLFETLIDREPLLIKKLIDVLLQSPNIFKEKKKLFYLVNKLIERHPSHKKILTDSLRQKNIHMQKKILSFEHEPQIHQYYVLLRSNILDAKLFLLRLLNKTLVSYNQSIFLLQELLEIKSKNKNYDLELFALWMDQIILSEAEESFSHEQILFFYAFIGNLPNDCEKKLILQISKLLKIFLQITPPPQEKAFLFLHHLMRLCIPFPQDEVYSIFWIKTLAEESEKSESDKENIYNIFYEYISRDTILNFNKVDPYRKTIIYNLTEYYYKRKESEKLLRCVNDLLGLQSKRIDVYLLSLINFYEVYEKSLEIVSLIHKIIESGYSSPTEYWLTFVTHLWLMYEKISPMALMRTLLPMTWLNTVKEEEKETMPKLFTSIVEKGLGLNGNDSPTLDVLKNIMELILTFPSFFDKKGFSVFATTLFYHLSKYELIEGFYHIYKLLLKTDFFIDFKLTHYFVLEILVRKLTQKKDKRLIEIANSIEIELINPKNIETLFNFISISIHLLSGLLYFFKTSDEKEKNNIYLLIVKHWDRFQSQLSLDNAEKTASTQPVYKISKKFKWEKALLTFKRGDNFKSRVKPLGSFLDTGIDARIEIIKTLLQAKKRYWRQKGFEWSFDFFEEFHTKKAWSKIVSIVHPLLQYPLNEETLKIITFFSCAFLELNLENFPLENIIQFLLKNHSPQLKQKALIIVATLITSPYSDILKEKKKMCVNSVLNQMLPFYSEKTAPLCFSLLDCLNGCATTPDDLVRHAIVKIALMKLQFEEKTFVSTLEDLKALIRLFLKPDIYLSKSLDNFIDALIDLIFFVSDNAQTGMSILILKTFDIFLALRVLPSVLNEMHLTGRILKKICYQLKKEHPQIKNHLCWGLFLCYYTQKVFNDIGEITLIVADYEKKANAHSYTAFADLAKEIKSSKSTTHLLSSIFNLIERVFTIQKVLKKEDKNDSVLFPVLIKQMEEIFKETLSLEEKCAEHPSLFIFLFQKVEAFFLDLDHPQSEEVANIFMQKFVFFAKEIDFALWSPRRREAFVFILADLLVINICAAMKNKTEQPSYFINIFQFFCHFFRLGFFDQEPLFCIAFIFRLADFKMIPVDNLRALLDEIEKKTPKELRESNRLITKMINLTRETLAYGTHFLNLFIDQQTSQEYLNALNLLNNRDLIFWLGE